MKKLIFFLILGIFLINFVSAIVQTPIHFTGFEADTTAPWDGWVDGGTDCLRSALSYCTDTTCAAGGSYSIQVQDNSATSYTTQTFNLSTACGGTACDKINLSMYLYPNSFDNVNEGFDIWCDYGTADAYKLADWKDNGVNNSDVIGGVEVPEDSWTKVEFDISSVCKIDDAVEIRITSQDSTSGGNTDQVYIDGINITGYNYDADIGLQLIDPTINENFTQYILTPFTVNVSCSGSDCGVVNVTLDPTTTYSFESSAEGWTSGAISGGVNQWHRSTENAHGGSYSFKFGDTGTGDYSVGSNGGLISPNLTIKDAPFTNFSFYHYLSTESGYDGGKLEYSLDGGAWAKVENYSFISGGYNNQYIVYSGGPTGWVDGEDIWTGTVGSAGNFNKVEVNVSNLTTTATNISFRFNFGSDSSVTGEGWYVDDVFWNDGDYVLPKGVISTVAGTTPFYTNMSSNPYPVDLTGGGSELVTFWVNATGTAGREYGFFSYANLTSNMVKSNITKIVNITILGDEQAPKINLNLPVDSATITNSTINFNFTAIDNLASTTRCSIYINGSLNQTNSSVLNNTLTNFEINNLEPGLHEWNISCTDGVNVNQSEVRSFNVNVIPNISVINASPDPIGGNKIIAIQPSGVSDPSNDNLRYYCVNDSSLEINLTNTICSQGDTVYSYPYSSMNCTYEVPFVNAVQNISCRVYDGTYYSNNVTTNYTIDSTAPVTTVNNVAGDVSVPYYDTTNDGQTNITIDGEANMLCRWYTSDQAYNAGTGNACTTFGTQAICITNSAEGLPDYYVSCADSLGNGQNTTQNLDVTSITIDWTAPTTSDDSTAGIKAPNYTINLTEADNIDGDPTTKYCTDTIGTCNPTTTIDNGGTITFNSLNRGQNYLRYYSIDYVGNIQSVQNVSIKINQLPVFEEANANESGNISGGIPIKITTNSNDLDENQSLTLYVCNTTDVTSSGCVAKTYCTNTTNQNNASCIFISETDTASHNWYAFIYDSLNEVAINNYSGSYTTDSTPPKITISHPQNITYNESAISASISLNEDGDWVGYSLDGEANISMSNITFTAWTKTISSLTNGLHNITFWANDSYGNMNNSEMVYFTVNVAYVDTTAPSIIIYSPTNGTYYTNPDSLLVNITSDEDLSWAGYSYNGTIYDLDNYTLRNWNKILSGLSDETEFNLTIYANDTSNNSNSKSVQFYVDSLAPRMDNAQVNPSPTNVSVPVNCSVYLNDTYEISNVDIAENSLGSYENHTISFSGTEGWANYTIVGSKLSSAGTYTCIFYAEDSAGNSNSTSINFDVNDVTAPVLTIISPDNATYNQNIVDAKITTNEDVSWAGYSLDGAANVTMDNTTRKDWNSTLTGLSETLHSIIYYANDSSGNLGVSDIIYFTINTAAGDTVPPVISIDYPMNGTYYTSTNLFLNVSSNEDLDLAWYSLNGASNTTMGNSSTTNWNSILNGLGIESTNTLVVYGNDTSSNLGIKTSTFYVDTLAPRMDNAQVNPSPTNVSVPVNCSVYLNDTFALTNVKIAENSEGVYENHTISISGTEGWANYTIIGNKLSSAGTYTCIFYAEDSAGNSNSTSINFDVNDVTAPIINIDSPLNQTYSTNSILFSVATNENVDYVKYSLDGGTNTSLTGNNTSWSDTVSVSDGGHILEFYGEDIEGNIGHNSIIFTVDASVNDITPPTITIWSPLNNTYYTSSSTLLKITTNEDLSWAGYRNNSGIIQNLDNSSKTSWDKTVNFIEGQHNITFYANDTSSNKNQANKTITVYVDLTNPSVDSFYCNSSINNSLDVICNGTFSDAIGLDYAIISNNATGSWVNSSQISLSGAIDSLSYTIDAGDTSPPGFSTRIYLYDLSGRINDTSFYDVTVLDDASPIINNVTYTPTSTDDLDPGVTVYVNTSITEDYNISYVKLMYKNSSASDWTYVTMSNNSNLVVGSPSTIVYNASFTPQNGTWYFKINSSDSQGNINVSSEQIIVVENDTSQNISTTIPDIKSFTYAQRSGNNSLGQLILNNTGDGTLDFNVTLTSASLGTRLSINYTSNQTINYSVSSGSVRNITIAVNTTSLPSDLYNYNVTVVSNAGTITYNKKLNIQSSTEPYLEVSIDTYSANVTKGEIGVKLVASVINLGTKDATGVWLNWSLPSGFSIISGSSSRYIGNLPVGLSATNTLTISVSSSVTDSNVNLTAITNAINADLANDTKVVTIGNPITITTPTTGTSGGGGGGSSGVGQESVVYSKTIEIVRGEEDSFYIEIDNKRVNASLENLELELTGFLSQYITISPSRINEIGPGESKSFKVTLKIPSYKESYEEHTLKAVVRGEVVKPDQTSKIDYTETQNIKLIIQEVSHQDSNLTLIEAEKAVDEMRDADFNIDKVSQLLEQAKAKLLDNRNRESQILSEEIIEIKKDAFEANDLIRKIIEVLQSPKKSSILTGNIIMKVKEDNTNSSLTQFISTNSVFSSDSVINMLNLAIVAFQRGDYTLANERAGEARNLLILGRKGNLVLFFYLYWHFILLALIIFGVMGFMSYRLYTKSSINEKIEDLDNEEKNLRKLSVNAQKRYFGGKSSTEEYKKIMNYNQKELARLRETALNLRNKRISLLKPEQVHQELINERLQVEAKIKRIQRDFYKDNKISESEYNNQFKILNERLAEIEDEKTTLDLLKEEKIGKNEINSTAKSVKKKNKNPSFFVNLLKLPKKLINKNRKSDKKGVMLIDNKLLDILKEESSKRDCKGKWIKLNVKKKKE